MSNSNSKDIDLSLEQLLARLALVAGTQTDAGLVARFGLSKSTLNNWRNRGTVPYKTLVLQLLKNEMSLDWFFAPGKRLKVPKSVLYASAQGAIAERDARYCNDHEMDELIAAMQSIQVITDRNGVTLTAVELKLFLSVYHSLAGHNEVRAVTLENMARALAVQKGQHEPIG